MRTLYPISSGSEVVRLYRLTAPADLGRNDAPAYNVAPNGAGGAVAFAVLINKPVLAANDLVVI